MSRYIKRLQKGTVDAMDNFKDKLAQKFSAQEIIAANAQAEVEEMERLKLQVSEYERILQEMRKLNYKNTELVEKIDSMIGENAELIQGMKQDEQKLLAALRDLTDEQTRNREAELAKKDEERLEQEQNAKANREAAIAALAEMLEKKFERSDDFVHKENVKVYRNVQAVVVDELKNHAENIQSSIRDCMQNDVQNGINGIQDTMKKNMQEIVQSCIQEHMQNERDEFGTKISKAVICSMIAMAASIVGAVLCVLMAIGFI